MNQEHQQNPLPTLDSSGKRRWIYPDRRPGSLASARRKLAMVLMVLYLGTPWITIGGHPLLRLEILTSRFFIAGQVFSFAEIYYFVFIALALAFALLLITSLKGRLWCGFACPQTVFLEWLIRPIEELIEGKAHHRRSMDKLPLNLSRLTRKIVKHSIFLGLSALIANTLLAYFIAPQTLWHWNTSPPWHHPYGFAIMAITTLGLYGDFAWFREQFCTFACPYAKFQAVLIDVHTPVIAYDRKRGEPRGKHQGGDCIDCHHCVRVCPTGIDIRDGLQLECIQCTRCADACNAIMSNLSRPKGLIRFASEAELGLSTSPRSKRYLLYGLGLLAALGALAFLLAKRQKLDLVFLRVPGQSFVEIAPSKYSNQFNVRAVNQTNEALPISLNLDIKGEIICGSCSVPLAPFEERRFPLVVIIEKVSAAPLPKEGILRHDFTQDTWVLPLILPGDL